ncbi:MAG: GDYXXLXY domain-containing protein [Oceanospirillaceae bacterium]
MINNYLSSQTLWNLLKQNNAVTTANPPLQNDVSSWYIRLIQGFAGWLAACFLVAFIGSIFAFTLFNEKNSIQLILLGLACSAFAYFIFKSDHKRDFVQQLALAFNLCGQFLISWGLAVSFDFNSFEFYISLFSLQLCLVFLQNNYIARLLSTWFAMIALFLCLRKLDIANLSPTLVFILFSAVWMLDLRWLKRKDLWEPIGYGLAITLVMFSGKFFFRDFADMISDNQQQLLATKIFTYWLNQLLISAVFVYLLNSIRVLYQIPLQHKNSLKLALLGVLLIVTSYLVVGVSAAYLLLGVGFLKQRRILVIIGALSLLGFISWYYYNLNWTLLYKSIVLIGFSICFGIGAYWMHISAQQQPLTLAILKQKYQFNLQSKLVTLWVIVIIALLNFTIYQREALLSTGQSVLLKLAPVDPRSLMQGDYMRLRFDIESTLLEKSKDQNGTDNAVLDDTDQGLFVVELDGNSVASYKGIYQGQVLAENQIKMQFRVRKRQVRLATHAFFFEEGSADLYSKAVYGEFRVAKNGELLLNSMQDKQFKTLGLNRPEN